MNDFLQITNFSCGYPGKFMLKKVSLDIKKGSFIGIVGPNGSGKTTLFRGVSGDVKAVSGSIKLNGNELLTMHYKEKARNLAVVSQYIETPDITVEEYVLMGRLPFRKPFMFFESKFDFELVDKYLKSTDIYHLRSKLMTQLSGGEQQLASIARALTQQPQLLLLDEPTSHLDISHQVQVLNYLQTLNHQTGLTVIMIIHDLNLAGEYCDYLVMLNEGEIHTQGEPEDVLTYENIEQVYNTVVVTQKNPVSGKPAIFLVSEKVMKQNKEVNF